MSLLDDFRTHLLADDGPSAVAAVLAAGESEWWIDDNWNLAKCGSVTALKKSIMMDLVADGRCDRERQSMLDSPDSDVIRCMAGIMCRSYIGIQEIREMDFKVVTVRGKRQLRLGGFHMEVVLNWHSEHPPSVSIDEMLRVLRAGKAREVKRERRPGPPTGYDGWAW